jgi:hypothetical protein
LSVDSIFGIVLAIRTISHKQRIVIKKPLMKKITILFLFTISVLNLDAQYYCIFDNPDLDVATSKITSDEFVNPFGELTNEDYTVENEVLLDADLVKRYYYNESNLLVAQRNYTLEGELTGDNEGISIYQYQYNSKQQKTTIHYFDEEKLAFQAAFVGPAKIEYEYDVNGNQIKSTYYNKYYQLLETGASIIEYTYDDQNRISLEKQYDSNKNLLTDIAPIIRYTYNERGQVQKQSFLNAAEVEVSRLMDNDDEYDVASIYYEYEGEVINMHYYNTKGVLLGTEKSVE